jgi:hypothetical protein
MINYLHFDDEFLYWINPFDYHIKIECILRSSHLDFHAGIEVLHLKMTSQFTKHPFVLSIYYEFLEVGFDVVLVWICQKYFWAWIPSISFILFRPSQSLAGNKSTLEIEPLLLSLLQALSIYFWTVSSEIMSNIEVTDWVEWSTSKSSGDHLGSFDLPLNRAFDYEYLVNSILIFPLELIKFL